MIGLSVSAWADFTKSGNIVTDNTTGLQWQDDAVGTAVSWQAAIDSCEALSLDGFSDWRLPNLNELISLVDYGTYSPSIDPTFQYTVSNGYWSSTTHANFASYAWGVNFSSGIQGSSSKSTSPYVRCVRAGQ